MNIIFTIIFLLSIAGGAAWGYINNLTVWGYIISLTISGFIGSMIIALIFTYLYFFQKESKQQGPVQKLNDLKERPKIK
ncbi:MAG: hypothetical protein HUK40_21900 [Desulfobacter sp.]|nr:hypothetical protein [Desulfobacter sp.]WDP86278.1 MAG: hypothetical protein HUN05_15055 [Desulfobacter sp.]